MVALLDKRVHGQLRAKQDIAVSVSNHYISQNHRDVEAEDLGRYHILMLGPTGSRKTFIVKKLVELLGVPVSFTSATSLVESGYRGRSVDEIVKALLDRADGNPRLAERGIILLRVRSANGTSASVGLAGRIMRSNRRSWLGRMRPDRGGAAERPIHAQGRIFVAGADQP